MDMDNDMIECVCLCGTEEEDGEEEPVKKADLAKKQVLSSATVILPESQNHVSGADRVSDYLQSRHIHELMNFLMAHLLAHMPEHPLDYLIKLLDSCMLCRAGLGAPPTLYNGRHVEQLLNSFDPGDRGWLSAAQVRRARATLGLPSNLSDTSYNDEQVPTKLLQENLCNELNAQLFDLLCAGIEYLEDEDTIQSEV